MGTDGEGPGRLEFRIRADGNCRPGRSRLGSALRRAAVELQELIFEPVDSDVDFSWKCPSAGVMSVELGLEVTK